MIFFLFLAERKVHQASGHAAQFAEDRFVNVSQQFPSLLSRETPRSQGYSGPTHQYHILPYESEYLTCPEVVHLSTFVHLSNFRSKSYKVLREPAQSSRTVSRRAFAQPISSSLKTATSSTTGSSRWIQRRPRRTAQTLDQGTHNTLN